MTHPKWAEVADDALVFKVRLIGFDGGNAVVGTPQGGIYLGIATKSVRWLDGEPVQGYVGRVAVPLWLVAKHRVLNGS